mgnify:CR=1 FL=1
MVSINYSSREVCCKIVYYGPGLSGKTTNLLYVHAKVPSDTRGKMISLATEADRTLYFDFLPINIGTINGFAAKFQLYTVPGQVYYNATRKLVLRGVDGVVFVADSQPDKMDENIESLINLEENLREYGYDINDMPMVIQYNKRDLPGVLPVEALNARLNTRGRPHFEASATVGNGVFDTLKLIIKLVLEKAKGSASNRPKPGVSYHEPPVAQAPVSASAQSVAVSAPVSMPPAAATIGTQISADGRSAASGGRSTQPIQTGATSTATEEEPPPAAESKSQYRPYPGSDKAAENARKISAAKFTPSASPEVDDYGNRASSVKKGIADSPDSGASLASPAMAPSLKRRGDIKKRGFFKRLFGIK